MKAIRTVVTGVGLVSPMGCDTENYFQQLLNGECGIDKVTRFDISDFATKIAAEVKDFDPSDFMEKKEIRRLDYTEQYAIAASQIAIDDSKLVLD
ncbi:MAG: beta-ketoacyl-[acyl-carrier-protein] synthase II, partial [candidate division Zixibacteria bacterium]|nr:beta-ketoacyl-[acyl-carrier-protein] synthase II [candidate division Zixibacteria bacterium]